MKISISDWADIEQVLPLALKYQVGLEVQEFTGPITLDQGEALAKEIHDQVKDIPVIGFHGPFSDLIPASRDPLIRQVTRQRFMQACTRALTIGAQHLILHSGFVPKTYPRDQWIGNALDFWIDLLAGNPFPGMIHIENVYEDEFLPLREFIDRANQEIKEERLTICLDIGHVNANSTKTLEEWIVGLGDRIRYVHLHNNDGVLDDHWRLGKGKIDMPHTLDLLRAYSPNSIWTVETLIDEIEPSLQWLQGKGYLKSQSD